MVKNLPANPGDTGLIPGLGRSLGGGNGNPLQYSCLEKPVDRGAWQATYSPWGSKESDTTEMTEHKYTINSFRVHGSQVYFGSKYFTEPQEYSIPSNSCLPTHSTAGNTVLFLEAILRRNKHLFPCPSPSWRRLLC